MLVVGDVIRIRMTVQAKKWLSYREQGLLRRALRAEEAREVTGMARRLAAIVFLQPALDDNCRRAAASAYAWRRRADLSGLHRTPPDRAWAQRRVAQALVKSPEPP